MFSKIRPLIFKVDPEKAHTLAIKSLKLNLIPNVFDENKNDPIFQTTIFEKKALQALINTLEKCNDDMKPEDIQTHIYTIGKENGYKENLRDWFKLIYEVVFGDENGPRMGFFISFFGVKETKQLIKDKIN